MPITPSPTPNPQAIKFTVGKPVGGPATFADAESADDPAARSVLELDGVASVFMTADFVTVTKTAEADWDDLSPSVVEALSAVYG